MNRPLAKPPSCHIAYTDLMLRQKIAEVLIYKKLLIGIEKDDFTVFDKKELFDMELYLGGAIASKSDDELILVSNARMKKTVLKPI